MAFNFNFPIVLGGPNSAGGITVGKIPSDTATTTSTTTSTTTTVAPLLPGLYAFGAGTPSSGIYQNITTAASTITLIDGSTDWTSFDDSSGFSSTNTLVVRKNNTELWGWGYNSYGQLAQNDTVHRSSPVQIAGSWSKTGRTAGIKSDGTLWGWGPSYGGVLGNNVNSSNQWKSSPIQTVAGGNTWTHVVTCGSGTLARKSDKSMWAWGQNYRGRLGTNNTTNYSSPVQVTYPTAFSWSKVCLTGTYAAAINQYAQLYMWGNNENGQLAQSNTMDYSRPQQIGTNDSYSHVAIGDSCTYAVKTDGTLWCWGKNSTGLRLGIEENWYTPNNQNIVDPAQVNGGGSNWVKSAICGDYARVFLKSDGTMWGIGNLKNLGMGYPTDSTAKVSSPVQIGGGQTGWTDIIAYNDKFFAIKSS